MAYEVGSQPRKGYVSKTWIKMFQECKNDHPCQVWLRAMRMEHWPFAFRTPFVNVSQSSECEDHLAIFLKLYSEIGAGILCFSVFLTSCLATMEYISSIKDLGHCQEIKFK